MAYTEEVVGEYMDRRFPRASAEERRRTIADWVAKTSSARGTAEDFERRVGPLAGLRVLDVGSGNGGIAIAFAERDAQVDGVEIEEELAEFSRAEAKEYGSKAQFTLYDGTTLPFSDGTFDAAISVSVIEHVENPVRYFTEILRVLKPDGVLYFAFPNRLNLEETHTGLWGPSYLPRPLAELYLRLMHARPLADHGLHFYSYWAMRKILNKVEYHGRVWRIRPEQGASRSPLKRAMKRILRAFGVPHQALLPHVMLLLEPVQK